jgi:hypothetical protein
MYYHLPKKMAEYLKELLKEVEVEGLRLGEIAHQAWQAKLRKDEIAMGLRAKITDADLRPQVNQGGLLAPPANIEEVSPARVVPSTSAAISGATSQVPTPPEVREIGDFLQNLEIGARLGFSAGQVPEPEPAGFGLKTRTRNPSKIRRVPAGFGLSFYFDFVGFVFLFSP